MLKASYSKSATDFGDDCREDTNEFVGFFVKKPGALTVDATVLHEEFEPELRFIRFLKQPIEL